jgi:hypothetical protein
MSHPNPIRDTYNATVTMLNASSGFSSLFSGNKFITLNPGSDFWTDAAGQFVPDSDIDNVAAADFPRTRLYLHSIGPMLESTSSDSQVNVEYRLETKTGAEQQGLQMDCDWQILQAIMPWRTYLQDVVTWNDQPCIVELNAEMVGSIMSLAVGSVQEKKVEEEGSQGYDQWTSLWRLMVKFSFQTSSIGGP